MRRWVMALALVGCTSETVEPAPEDPSAAAIEAYDPLPLVDPFIATGGDGAEIASVSPGAAAPFGMTLVGPDTRSAWGSPSFYHCAGYWYNDTHIHNFSHTHAHGMGVTDYGSVAFMPRDGWDPAYTTVEGRAAPFDHAEEWASPGRYGVVLQDQEITVDSVATLHGGHTVMTFAAGADPVVVLDLAPSITSTKVGDTSWIEWAPGERDVVGFHLLQGSYSDRFGGVQNRFHLRFDPAPVGGGAWQTPDAPVDGETRADGNTGGVWLQFPAGTTTVSLRAAISTVDADGALANLEAELPDNDQAARITEVEAAWREHLGKVRVRGGSEDDQVRFHTALYHSSLMPSRQDDVDGRYRGLDGEVHTADHPYYSNLSLWDTFRTLHPWYILAWPDVQTDVLKSLVRMTEDGGAMPRWPMAHGYTGGMVGTPATQLFTESWFKGLRDFDVEVAWAGLMAQADGTAPAVRRGGIEAYIEHGFVPMEAGSGAGSNTLEYAWSDAVLADWGEALGKDVTTLRAQSQNWKNVWNADSGYFNGRCLDAATTACADDGEADTWMWNAGSERVPKDWSNAYIEGNSYHYLWYVPYDVDAMIEVQHGGDREAFLERYRSYWYDGVFLEEDDILPDDYYWHGNEPVMHYAFLGSLAGDADVTADASRHVLATRHDTTPSGLDGNDDSGTLSAWYLLASMGFFPIAGTDHYAVASPIFERLEIDRDGGEPFVVRAPGTSEAARYVQTLTIGGDPVTSSVVTHGTLWGNGDVIFELGEEPAGFGGGE